MNINRGLFVAYLFLAAVIGFFIHAGLIHFILPSIDIIKFLTDISNILMTIFAGVLLYQIIQTEKWNKINLAHAILPSTTIKESMDYINSVAKDDLFSMEAIRENPDLAASKIYKNEETRDALLGYLSKINEFCSYVYKNLIDEKFAYEMYGYLIVRSYRLLKFYITYVNKTTNLNMFRILTHFAEKWEKQNEIETTKIK